MMDTDDKWIIVGRFGRPHGVKGFITVHSFTEPRENILKYPKWRAKINNQWQHLEIAHAEVNHKAILAKVDGYQDRESVSRLTNVEIAVSTDTLPDLDDGEYYWFELIGMKVMNQQGVSFGSVREILSTGAHDVLVVHGEHKHLIPYVYDKFIISINKQEGMITVDWDENF